MSTTKELSLYKDLPYQIRIRSNGNWDEIINRSFLNNTALSVTANVYNGLRCLYVESYNSANKVNLTQTVLPWKYEYSSELLTNRYCLMPMPWSYSNVVKGSFSYNFTVIGSPTIDNEIKTVEGFSNSNYLRLSNTFNPGSSSWEIVIKFKPDSKHNGSLLTKSVSDQYYDYGLRINLIDSGQMYYLLSSQAQSQFLFEGLGSNNYKVGEWNWVKFEFTGSAYNMYLSFDGSTWTLDKTYSSSSKLATYSSNTNIGNMPEKTAHTGNPWYFNGIIDLSETSIKVDGADWWIPTFTASSSSGVTETLPGVTYNFVDDGSATTLNCFTENFDDAVVLTPNVSYASHEMINPLGGTLHKLGVFTEIATTDDWEDEDNLVDWDMSDGINKMVVGSINTSSNYVGPFTTNDYLMQTGSFNPGSHWWTLYMGAFKLTETSKKQILAQSDGFILGIDENNHFFAKFYDADGEIGTLTITDYTASTTAFGMDAVISYDNRGEGMVYSLLAGTHNREPKYAELQSNRTILSGPITFGCGYNQVPQRLLGTVSIPAHTAYDYNNGTWTIK